MAEFRALKQAVVADQGEFVMKLSVNDDGDTDAVVELDGEPVVRRVVSRRGDVAHVEVEYLGQWATADDSTVSLTVESGVITGRSLGSEIGPIGRAELDAEMVGQGGSAASYAADLQLASERMVAELEALAAVDPQWKLPKPGCKFCTAKCSALGVACVAGCAGTGPLATVCAAGCAAVGVDCVTDCPCD